MEMASGQLARNFVTRVGAFGFLIISSEKTSQRSTLCLEIGELDRPVMRLRDNSTASSWRARCALIRAFSLSPSSQLTPRIRRFTLAWSLWHYALNPSALID